MAEKDIAEKNLESYNDVFADIVNGLLFDGEQVVKEEELESESEHSMYKADGKLHEQERDVAKYWKNGEIRIALYGLENQTSVDAIKHVDEFFKLMKVLTNDNMFGTVYNEDISNGNGGVNMDDFLSTVVAKGKNEGKIEGRAEIIQGLIKTGNMTVEQIADILKLPVEKVKELAEMVLVSA